MRLVGALVVVLALIAAIIIVGLAWAWITSVLAPPRG